MDTPVTPPLPQSPDRITPAFLTPILQSAGLLMQAVITAIEITPLVGKTQFNAQLARLHLTYDRFEPAAPHSLIAKLPTVRTELQPNAAIFRPGLRECWFYRLGIFRAPLNVPRCYYNTVSEAGQSFLLLEDLAPAQSGSWLDGASISEAARALRSIARLHAAWWRVDLGTEPELAALENNTSQAQTMVETLYQDAWPRFLDHSPIEIPDMVRHFGDRLVGHIAEIEALLEASPRTLMHGDFRLDNLLFGVLQGKPNCWVIDWEDVTAWNGMFDVAWFLGGCLPVEKAGYEESLLRGYHQALTGGGVQDYSWETCCLDYRRAMASSFVQGILTIAALDQGSPYTHDLASVLTERFRSVCLRHRLYEIF